MGCRIGGGSESGRSGTLLCRMVHVLNAHGLEKEMGTHSREELRYCPGIEDMLLILTYEPSTSHMSCHGRSCLILFILKCGQVKHDDGLKGGRRASSKVEKAKEEEFSKRRRGSAAFPPASRSGIFLTLLLREEREGRRLGTFSRFLRLRLQRLLKAPLKFRPPPPSCSVLLPRSTRVVVEVLAPPRREQRET